MRNWLNEEMELPNYGINALLLGFGFLGTQLTIVDMTGIATMFLVADYTAYRIGLYEGEVM